MPEERKAIYRFARLVAPSQGRTGKKKGQVKEKKGALMEKIISIGLDIILHHKKGELLDFKILIRPQNEIKVNVKTPETLLLGWNFNDRCSEMTLWRANERDRETTFTVSVLGEIEEMPPME